MQKPKFESYSFSKNEDGTGQDLQLDCSHSYYPFFTSEKRDVIAYGGAGAAKSYNTAQKIIFKCISLPDRKVLVTRKYGPSLYLTCYSLILELLNKYNLEYDKKEAKKIITFPNTNSEIIFIPIAETSNEKETAARIKSLTDLTDIWFEEVTELSFDEYKMVRLRLRGRELEQGKRQRYHTFNPINKNHWIHKFFFEPTSDGKLRDADRFKFTYKDNPYLDREYISELEELKMVDPVTYAVYALGEWGTLGNQIFTNYVVEEFSHSLNWYDEVVAGIDFGYVHPSVMLLVGVKESDIYVIDEICESKLTNTDFANKITAKLSIFQDRNIELFCDYAEPARIEEMKRMGLNVKEANKNVLEGLNVVLKYHQHLHPRCINTIKQIAGYRRKEDRTGNILERKPIKFNDDCMDALRYAVYGLSANYGGDYSTPVVMQESHIPTLYVDDVDVLRDEDVPQF